MIEAIPASGDYALSASPGWRERDWTRCERQLDIDGRTVNILDAGEGEVGFVLVHGMGGCWQHWLETIPFLSRHGRVLAVDLPGFGRSQRSRGRVTIEGLAETVAAVCGAVGLERVVVLGHSMGGPIAIRLATSHEELVSGIILVGGATDTFNSVLGLRGALGLALRRPKKAAAALTEVLTVALPTPRRLQRLIVRSPLLRRATLWPYLHRPQAMPVDLIASMLAGGGTPGVLPTAAAIGRSDPRRGLTEVRCPILSIGARQDHVCPPVDLEAWAKLVPSATTILLEDCGHMMMLERARTFNAQVERFLHTHPAASVQAA
jgi:pimeloyl-ACP methyl ester carboxylesterase